jgi:hypothetical protein
MASLTSSIMSVDLILGLWVIGLHRSRLTIR